MLAIWLHSIFVLLPLVMASAVFLSFSVFGQEILDAETCPKYKEEYIKIGNNPSSSEDKSRARDTYIKVGKCMDKGFLKDPNQNQEIKEVILSDEGEP